MTNSSSKPATMRAPIPSAPDLADLVRDYERAFEEANATAEPAEPRVVSRSEMNLWGLGEALAPQLTEPRVDVEEHAPVTLLRPPAPPSGVRVGGSLTPLALARRLRREDRLSKRTAHGRR
jgi:hypothetical protein